MNTLVEYIASAKTATQSNVIVIKLGGSVLDDLTQLHILCEDIKALSAAGLALVIVHGGGKAITRLLSEQHIQSTFIAGQRVTTAEMLPFIQQALLDDVNNTIVQSLQQLGVKAVTMNGAQGLLQCQLTAAELGWVGDITTVNCDMINEVLQQNFLPVIAPLGSDGTRLYNINADVAAWQIAASLSAEKLVYISDQIGIYDDDKKIIPELSAADIETLISSNVVVDGMLIKAHTILSALLAGIATVHVLDGKKSDVLRRSILGREKLGTTCYLHKIKPENHHEFTDSDASAHGC